MTERKNIDVTGGEAAAGPQAAPEHASIQPQSTKSDSEPALPAVESPSISPAISEPVAIEQETVEPRPEPEVAAAKGVVKDAAKAAEKPVPGSALVRLPPPAAESEFEPWVEPATPRATFKPRFKRYARMAASVAIGAAIGAAMGAVLTGGFAPAPRVNVAAQEESKSMQQSVAKLAKEVTTLKASLEATKQAARTQLAKEVTTLKANLEATQRAAQMQIANIDDKLSERLKKEASDITGSISAPQTIMFAPVPTPTPRPAPRIAAAQSQPPARPPVVPGWSIRDSRGGYLYVEGHGDIYQIVIGAPLPGLGPVKSVKKLDGRWVVSTPRGIIVSMRDRRYFE